MSKPTANEFVQAFLTSYEECRSLYPEKEIWNQVWGGRHGNALMWSWFMLYKGDRPPLLRSESVIERTAANLDLEYCDVNQLQFDGLLCAKGCKSPFSPILAALEHENVHPGFDTEIWKLMSVRCPLKVGITYSINESGKRISLEQLRDRVIRHFEAVSQVIDEDPSTEYVFLLGCEEAPCSLIWKTLVFSKLQGPRNIA